MDTVKKHIGIFDFWSVFGVGVVIVTSYCMAFYRELFTSPPDNLSIWLFIPVSYSVGLVLFCVSSLLADIKFLRHSADSVAQDPDDRGLIGEYYYKLYFGSNNPPTSGNKITSPDSSPQPSEQPSEVQPVTKPISDSHVKDGQKQTSVQSPDTQFKTKAISQFREKYDALKLNGLSPRIDKLHSIFSMTRGIALGYLCLSGISGFIERNYWFASLFFVLSVAFFVMSKKYLYRWMEWVFHEYNFMKEEQKKIALKRRYISMKRRFFSMVLVFVLLTALLPAGTVQAAETLTGPIKEVSLGDDHSAAIKTDGSLWTWGYNLYGRLGDGTRTERSTPVKIMDNVASVSLGIYHSAAIKTDGSLWTWGDNEAGRLGDGTTTHRSTPVKIMDNVASVSLGCYHSAAIKTDGSLWTWGDNNDGQLGDGTSMDRGTPVKIMDNVASVSLGGWLSAAIKTDGSLWTWGYSGYGQLGDGTTTKRSTPVKIMDNVVFVSLGAVHSAAIKTDGSLWTWGQNGNGQLGDGTTTDRRTPVKIMDNVVSVSLGGWHSAAIKADGSLWTWGLNDLGQLGDGTTTDRSTPVKIMDNVASVSLGGIHSAAIQTDGSLWTWGRNYYGQLGDGTTTNRSTPVCIAKGGAFPTTVPVTGITIPSYLALKEGETATLTAAVAPANASNKTVQWSSDNTAVATVRSGVVTAVGAGTAYITATTEDGGFTGSCRVTVEAEEIKVTGVTLSVQTLALKEGDTATLTATVTPADASNREIKWRSSDPSVATVVNGVVAAGKGGTAVITAETADGAYIARCEVTVTRVFNEYLYRADFLADLDNPGPATTQRYMYEIQTPSAILVKAGEENGLTASLKAWRIVTGIGDFANDPSSAADIPLEYKDIYSAIIINVLQSSASLDYLDMEYVSRVEDAGDFISSVNDILKSSSYLSSGNAKTFKQTYDSLKGADREKYVKDVSDSIKETFKKNQPDLYDMDDTLDTVSTSLKLLETVETAQDYFERVLSCMLIAAQCQKYQEVINEAYDLSLKTGNLYLQGALFDCKKMIESENEDILFNAIAGQSVAVGKKALQFLFQEVYWNGVKQSMKLAHPAVWLLLAAYSGSKLLTNALFQTDSINKQFSSMEAMLEVEDILFEANKNLRKKYENDRSVDTAKAFINSHDIVYFALNEDCKQATSYVDIIDEADWIGGLGDWIKGNDSNKQKYEKSRKSIKNIQSSYAGEYDWLVREWVTYLEYDFPDSGLEEYYTNKYNNIPSGTLTKQILAACPVDVYIYNSRGNLVASVVGETVTCEDDSIMIARLGDEKVVRFYGNEEYRVEYAGTGTGTMDISISEYDQEGETIRTADYSDVPLNVGKKYEMPVDKGTMNRSGYQLSDASSHSTVNCDYDSLVSSDVYSVDVKSGLLLLDGELLLDGKIRAGERVGLSAVVPEGYQFVCWQSNDGSLSITDSTSRYASFVMPQNDVIVTAVMEKTQKQTVFSDVNANSYYWNAVQWAVNQDITKGTGATTFSPAMNVTRGQAVTFLWRAMGEPMPKAKSNPFKDVKSGDWFYDAVLWAVEQGITKGTAATTFSPDDPVTRGQMLTFLYRTMGEPGKTGTGAWYADAENWAKGQSLLTGTAAAYTTDGDCPRSDVVYYLWKVLAK